MFKTQSLTVLLACITSANAFSTISVGRSTSFVQRSSIVAAPSKTSTVVFSSETEVSEDAASAETDSVAEVAEVVEVAEATPEVEVAEVEAEAEAAAPAEAEEEKKTAEKPEEDIRCVAYVVNLSYETEYNTLKDIFATHGRVQKIFVPKNKATGQNKGIAFVTMESEEVRDATIAALNETQIDGRTVYVDKAKPRGEVTKKPKEEETKLYIGNISYETTAEDLETAFSEYGVVSNVYLPTDRISGNPRGFAFLAMNPSEAEKAIEAFDGTQLGGRNIEVKVSLPRGQKAPRRQNKKDETKVYVGNLSFDTEEQTIRELFQEYGPIIDLYVPFDLTTERPRGFAFITLEPDMAQRAIEECDSYELDGRMLRVNEAQPRGSGGGGGYSDDAGAEAESTNEW